MWCRRIGAELGNSFVAYKTPHSFPFRCAGQYSRPGHHVVFFCDMQRQKSTHGDDGEGEDEGALRLSFSFKTGKVAKKIKNLDCVQ